MTREATLAILRSNEQRIKEKGILALRLFGSVARDEANEHSDVDVIVEMQHPDQISLFELGGVQQDFVELLGTNVDLSQEHTMKQRIRDRALQDAVLVF